MISRLNSYWVGLASLISGSIVPGKFHTSLGLVGLEVRILSWCAHTLLRIGMLVQKSGTTQTR
jgi:hypothetical protein